MLLFALGVCNFDKYAPIILIPCSIVDNAGCLRSLTDICLQACFWYGWGLRYLALVGKFWLKSFITLRASTEGAARIRAAVWKLRSKEQGKKRKRILVSEVWMASNMSKRTELGSDFAFPPQLTPFHQGEPGASSGAGSTCEPSKNRSAFPQAGEPHHYITV